MHEVDVVVVGAGLAGLSAARKLVAEGLTVKVLEARDRVAGRNLGGFLSNGVPVEMGGQWVGPTQDAVLELIKELGLETFPSYDDGEALMVFDDNVVRYADETFGLPLESAMEVGRLWEQIETLASTVTTERAVGDRRGARPRPADPGPVAGHQHRGHHRAAVLPPARPGGLLRRGPRALAAALPVLRQVGHQPGDPGGHHRRSPGVPRGRRHPPDLRADGRGPR